MRDDLTSALTSTLPVRTWPFVAACAIAGALAVPLHAITTLASAVVAGIVGLLGLHVWRWSRLASSTRTKAPHGVERLIEPAISMALGLIVGLLLLAVIRLAIEPVVPAIGTRMAAAAALPIWRRILIIYVAAVGEELVFRLLLLSLITALMVRLYKLPDQAPNRNTVWMAIGLSALAFAAVHLPAWSEGMPLSLGLALVVLMLNALGGVVFGYVFVNRGIVAAILTHASADIAIQLIGPLTG